METLPVHLRSMNRLRALHAAARGLAPVAWRLLLAVCLLGLGTADVVLLELSRGLFSTGYNGVVLDSGALIGRFVLGALALDLSFILGLWAIGVPVLRRMHLSPFRVFGWSAAGTLGLAFWITLIRYSVHTVIGHLVGFHVILELAGGSLGALADSALPGLAAKLLAGVVVVLQIALVWWALRLTERHLPVNRLDLTPPSAAMLSTFSLVFAVLGVSALASSSDAGARVRVGLEAKPSGVLLSEIVQQLTDVDRDGFGWLSRPGDPAPFDASVSPYAIDWPGNGVDENRLAGDHPRGFQRLRATPGSPLPGGAHPHLLLIYLEGFRGDLIDRRLNGREITPFLNRLGREGAKTGHAYAHSPYTVRSRAQLFGGTLIPRGGQPTLIDDFKARGYRVAYFSAQDDSFGDGLPFLGVERADLFYSARQDVDRRTSRSTHPSSLQLSWQTLSERVFAFLDAHDPHTPLFAYVNFVDTHFPYFRGQQLNLLEIEPVTRSEIRPENARRVFETYANAAANVDGAIEGLVQRWWRLFGRANTAILITADHGQAFYESGFLGHGRALDDAQSRVPLILWGIGGDWPEPIGAADLRGLLRTNLPLTRGTEPLRARFRERPERRIFQYLPNLEWPSVLAIRGLAGAAFYDFERGRTWLVDQAERPVNAEPSAVAAAFRSLVLNWEALRLESASPAAGASPAEPSQASDEGASTGG